MAVNGGSLEDCYSNVFALTELNGLKWRCFVTPSNAPRGVPVPSDFVLRAYGKCLQHGIICTWRRKPLVMSSTPEPLPVPSFTNDISKELWLFWYTNEPPENLSDFTSQLEHLDEFGIGTAANGIPYEVRVLFFKALHTVIERNLSRTGVIRLGKWFTKPLRLPLPGRQHMTSSYVMAFNLQFFVHGGNTVCLTVNAQRQPTLLRLAKRHLECDSRVQVILGPWSLRGTLLPQSEWGDSTRNQINADRQWEEWKEFVMVEHESEENEGENGKDDLCVPRMVCVELDGIRMFYPSSLVCLTLEEDCLCQQQQGGRGQSAEREATPPPPPNMIPEELRVSATSHRNPLLVSNINGLVHLQGVLQNAHLGRKQATPLPAGTPTGGNNQDSFQKPFPVQADDDTKWNFVDPGRSDVCGCAVCRFEPPPGFQGESLPDRPALSCPLALPIPVRNPAFPNQKRTNPALFALKRQSKRKAQHSYHRRWAPGWTGPRPSSPETSMDASSSSGSDGEEGEMPGWTDRGKKTLPTGIYCSTDDANTHYGVASPANSSDDENLQCSPFTPIKVISPCHECHWPSAAADQIPEATFNEIFQRGSSSRLPPTACQEEKSKDYDYYYNPTLREEPFYMSYHSRRQGEKRHSSYPPAFQFPLSPDQPGSQETIPATTSPPPDVEERRRIPAGTQGGQSQTTREGGGAGVDTQRKTKDESCILSLRPRRTRCRRQSWPDIGLLNVDGVASQHREDIPSKIPPLCGLPVPSTSAEKEVDHYDGDSEDNRAIGEGPSSGVAICPEATSVGEEPMEVDGPMPMENILSPPASNEQIESYSHPSWPRMGGPPSVGDPFQLNHIYPTPPSVMQEGHQFSPVGGATQGNVMSVVQSQAERVTAMDLMNCGDHPQNIKEEPTEAGEGEQTPSIFCGKYSLEEEPDTIPLQENTKMGSLWKRVSHVPVAGFRRKFGLDGGGRFGAECTKENKEEEEKPVVPLKPRPSELPPDYQKILRQQLMGKGKPTAQLLPSDPSSVVPFASSPSMNMGMTGTMSPAGPPLRANPAYKISFGPGPPMVPSPAMSQQQQQMMAAHNMGYGPPGTQMGMPRGGPGMMGGGRMGPYGPGPGGVTPGPYGPGYMGGGPPGSYGGPPTGPPGGYGTVQQLNNFVNGPMPPMYGVVGGQSPMSGMGGGLNSHMNQPGGPPQMGMYQSQQMMQSGQPGMIPYGMDPAMQQQQQMNNPNGGFLPGQYGAQMGSGGAMNAQQQMHMMRQQQQQHMQQQQHPSSLMQQQSHQSMSFPSHGGPSGGVPGGPHQMPAAVKETVVAHAEGTSLVLAIILQDTILDLHYDTVFDACPICSCNTSIRARELGLYITPSDTLRLPSQQQAAAIHSWCGFGNGQTQQQGAVCNCGFSAVRHRYLCLQSGLFPEDSREATANDNSIAPVGTTVDMNGTPISRQIWFNPSSHQDVNVLNLLRVMCLRQGLAPGKMVHQIAYFHEYAEKATKGQDVGFSIDSNSEYIVSQIDSTELLLLGNSTVDMALVSGSRTRNKNEHKFLQFFHPWGLQLANEVREPKESEWRGLLCEMTPVLEKSMKLVRCSQQLAGSIVEGPLTWKSLTSKRQKASSSPDDDSSLSEPLPYVLIANEKDLIRTSPQAIRLWEQLSLGPVDQPKDVLYITVVPDNSEIQEKATQYMNQLSQMYERMRLGRHIAWNIGEIEQGILRAGGRPSMGKCTRASFDFLEMVGKYIDNRVLLGRLRLFTQEMEALLVEAFSQFDAMFDRATYRAALAMDARAKKAAAAHVAHAAERNAERQDGSGAGQSGGSTGQIGQKTGEGGSPPVSSASLPPQSSSSDSGGLSDIVPMETQQQGAQQPIPVPIVPNTIFKEDPPLEAEEIPTDDYGALPHVIVIYVMNPFTWGTDSRSVLCGRVATLALMRTFNAVCSQIPQHRRPQLHLELLPMEQMGDMMGMLPDFMNDGRDHSDVYEKSENDREVNVGYLATDSMKATCLSVYSAPRALLPDAARSVQARCMTKFGPGSSLLESIAELERGPGPPLVLNVPSSPYHLAPPPFILQDQTTGKITQIPQEEQVLYVTYCLIGGEFLCAAVTDSQGRLNDNCLININIKTPNAGSRSGGKQRSKTQILDAMSRLWFYLQGLIASDIRNVRLVIGRLGKIGHGEFRAWTHLLAKSALRKVSFRPKEMCTACFEMPGSIGTPSILSACLISTEPEPYLRIFPAFFNQDTYVKGKSRALSTPEDTSCTHIMVFPVNTQIELSVGEQSMEDDNDMDAWGEIAGLDLPQDDEFSNIQDMLGGLDNGDSGAQPSASFRSGQTSAFFPDNGNSEPMQNQPLATGFTVSTAPPGDLPDWFWASCPSAKRRAPVHLKSSLHINVQCAGGDQDQGDDFIQQGKSATNDKFDNTHPLDSQRTDEVLRHVLETYNALSWLNVDVVSGERKSCLPIHIQSLLRLYHSVARLIV